MSSNSQKSESSLLIHQIEVTLDLNTTADNTKLSTHTVRPTKNIEDITLQAYFEIKSHSASSPFIPAKNNPFIGLVEKFDELRRKKISTQIF